MNHADYSRIFRFEGDPEHRDLLTLVTNPVNLFILFLFFVWGCSGEKQQTDGENVISGKVEDQHQILIPDSLDPVSTATLSNNIIEAVFVDNSRYGKIHRAGYNGIARLKHRDQDSSIFVPEYAGYNLEHIFGGDSLVELFEPRTHPMELYRLSNRRVMLYQSPTPLSNVESRTIFSLVDPHYIDVEFSFIIHDKKFFNHNYAGLFWASYIHAPSDKHIYFRGQRKSSDSVKWIGAYSREHGLKSTHLFTEHLKDIYFAPDFNARLASHFSDYYYTQPFFFGKFHNMALVYMFDRTTGIRFSQSPTGGGASNPAWDFQYIVKNFETGKKYSFHSRLVFKVYKNRQDIIEEFNDWAQYRK